MPIAQQPLEVPLIEVDAPPVGIEARVPLSRIREARPGSVLARAAIGVPMIA